MIINDSTKPLSDLVIVFKNMYKFDWNYDVILFVYNNTIYQIDSYTFDIYYCNCQLLTNGLCKHVL